MSAPCTMFEQVRDLPLPRIEGELSARTITSKRGEEMGESKRRKFADSYPAGENEPDYDKTAPFLQQKLTMIPERAIGLAWMRSEGFGAIKSGGPRTTQ